LKLIYNKKETIDAKINLGFTPLQIWQGFLSTRHAMDGENAEPKQLSSFEKYDEFVGYLQTVMDVDLFSDAPSSPEEDDAFRRLQQIVRLSICV
jgi:hypothetical protein